MKKILVLLPILLLILVILSFFSIFIQTGKNDLLVSISINQGTSANEIANMLASNKVIENSLFFKLAAFSLNMQNKIQSGEYTFNPHGTLVSTLIKLRRGDTNSPNPIKVTFPEGTSIYKMGSILQKTGFLHFEEFRKLTNTPLSLSLALKYDFLKANNSYSFEGYLFPDTYIIEKTTSTEVLANMMLKRFNVMLWFYWKENGKNSTFSFYNTLILASIIEKEARLDAERPIISSVFYNRMKMKMPLASDPTIKYILENPTKHVYLKQLQIRSPYNTYKNMGLTPTPICNPGLASFKAAIYPANTNYIYFVARKDGSHIFSSSWKEHQKARGSVL
ncbi:endolytic transglycosylase MltG [Candidatus Saganbacteria bacterium]|nr:endolytic transglycosylase MltG [Candidatus Saganbacteria bacterium]